MTVLYTPEYAAKVNKVYKKYRLICPIAAFTTLLACVVMCFFVNTRTAGALFFAAAGLSIFTGWAYLLFLRPKRRRLKAERAHIENMTGREDAEEKEGEIKTDSNLVQIPGSILIKKVRLLGGGEAGAYSLNAAFNPPPNGAYVKLTVKGGFVCGFEVLK